MPLPAEISESDYMGAYFGEPIDVVACQTIDLQVPASAEIVIEGYVSHDETAMEGPMGEYAGYADTCRGEPPRGCGAFPGAAQVSGQRPGEAQLGMTGEDQPGPGQRLRGRGSWGRSSRGPA